MVKHTYLCLGKLDLIFLLTTVRTLHVHWILISTAIIVYEWFPQNVLLVGFVVVKYIKKYQKVLIIFLFTKKIYSMGNMGHIISIWFAFNMYAILDMEQNRQRCFSTIVFTQKQW